LKFCVAWLQSTKQIVRQDLPFMQPRLFRNLSKILYFLTIPLTNKSFHCHLISLKKVDFKNLVKDRKLLPKHRKYFKAFIQTSPKALDTTTNIWDRTSKLFGKRSVSWKVFLSLPHIYGTKKKVFTNHEKLIFNNIHLISISWWGSEMW
jgi:hypothetical protein